jgi:toxin HigB-1
MPSKQKHKPNNATTNQDRPTFAMGWPVAFLKKGVNWQPISNQKPRSWRIISFIVLHGYRESDIIFWVAIRSFGDPATADLYHGRNTSHARLFPKSILSSALRKMELNAAYKLDDLRSPPGNRMELLKGDLESHHSIRVNDQWRITFRWNGGA